MLLQENKRYITGKIETNTQYRMSRPILKNVDPFIYINKKFCRSLHSFPAATSIFNFNRWVSGLIDGDGYFEVRHIKSPLCAVAAHENEIDNLEALKGTFGGTISRYTRMGGIPTRGLRLVLTGRENVAVLLNAVNGYIHNPIRYERFQACCQTVGIIPQQFPLTVSSSWLAGFIDSDGHIRIERKTSQARVTIGQKEDAPLLSIKLIWGGVTYVTTKGHCSWNTNDNNVDQLISYLLVHLRGKNKREQLQYFARIHELRNQKPRDKAAIAEVCAAFWAHKEKQGYSSRVENTTTSAL